MSLINEALKKAQRARHHSADGGVADASGSDAGVVRTRGRPRSELQSWVFIGVGAVGVIALGIALVVVFVNRTPPDSTASKDPQPAITPAPITTPAPEEVTAPKIAVVDSAPEPAPSENPPSIAPTDSAPPAAAPIESTASASSPQSAQPQTKGGENPLVYDYLDQLRVTGVRASDTDPKVLMNDRVYRVGDLVNRSLALRVTGIAADKLTFTDDSGVEYTKEF